MEFSLEIETFYNLPVGVPPWCLIKTHSPSPWFSEVVLYAQRGGDVHKLYSVFELGVHVEEKLEAFFLPLLFELLILFTSFS